MPYADYSFHLASNRARQKTAVGKANHAKANALYRQRNALKYKAHCAVNNAIRDGHMVKMDCEHCGSKQAQAHHDDYSKPLVVRWLCDAAHKQWHREHQEAVCT